MTRSKYALLTFLALFLCGLIWSGSDPLIAAYRTQQKRPAAAKRGPAKVPSKAQAIVPTVAFTKQKVEQLQRPTPGQLTIMNPQGQPAGVCPLKHTDVNADVAGYVARVTVRQQFHNPTHEPIEAMYTFPLPEDAAVDDMTMTIGQRLVKGEIKRREEARQIYEAAKTAGQAASLLDQERPNIFTQSVANIMPGEDISITISYVNLLKYDDGKYEFAFPTVVGPRFIPNGGGYTVPGKRGEPSPQPGADTPVPVQMGPVPPGASRPLTRERRIVPPSPRPPAPPSVTDGLPPRVVTDADKITPPITPPGTRAGHDLTISVKIDAGLPLGPITSPLHKIDVTPQGPNRAVVRLQGEKTIPNKDFILRYTAAGSEMRSGILTHAPGDGSGGYFTLVLQPPARPAQSQISPKEMVFVIDQTGSQSGWPIEKAKETMRHCIRSMNPGDTFQLIGFNTEIFPAFPAPVPNSPQNVAAALKFLEPLQGNGGTDILKSVDYALKLPADPNRLRVVCYMTDGFVGNDMQILDYVRKNRGEARMFVFGIGNGVNRFLIEGMAKEGRGAAEIVTLEDDGNAAAQKFTKRIASPVLLDPQVDWSGLPVADVYPQAIPDVFSAGPIIVKGRYTRPAKGDLIVRGILRGQPWSQRIPVDFPAADKDGSALATLWARQRIEELQSQDWMGAQTGKPIPNIQQQIIDTALQYRLMSQYTSFVAVEQRVINVNGVPKKIDVPVEMVEGVSYEGIFGRDKRLDLAGAKGSSRSRGIQPVRRMSVMAKVKAPASPSSSVQQNVPAGKPLPSLAPAQPSAGATANGSFGGGGFGGVAPLADGTVVESLSAAPAERRMELDVAEGKKEALAHLSQMKPEERRAILARAKLHPALHGLAEKVKRQGKGGNLTLPGVAVQNGKVTVLVWLNALPKDGLKRLKALGFDLNATLTPNKLLLGTLSAEKLDQLVELSFVRRVEPPKFK
ncbi:MAG: VIT and VWA domain-containing protein [Armatimonadetes bacterium]|nr:VIT and VWA domain-containing protein [Armatimonadota bacterium]